MQSKIVTPNTLQVLEKSNTTVIPVKTLQKNSDHTNTLRTSDAERARHCTKKY